jgi:hypothetical protein
MGETGHMAHTGEKINAQRRCVANPKGRSILGRPRIRWEDNS